MEKIKTTIIKSLSLVESKSLSSNCYQLAKKRYLVFYDKKVEKININDVLDDVRSLMRQIKEFKSIIVVATTKDKFTRSELFYFDGVDTFIVFYLIDLDDTIIYLNDNWIFTLGLNYKKYVKKINKVVRKIIF